MHANPISRPQANAFQRRTCLALAAMPLLHSLGVQAQVVNVTGAELVAMKLKADGITLDFPRLADTGASVPLHADIVAPAGLKIASIEVFLPENPNTRAIKLRLVEPQARYALTTRLRMAASQDAWVVATLTDGSRRGASAPTVITSSACFDGS
jgi:predicted secreted protein